MSSDSPTPARRRSTIQDIAAAAGVSSAAVSYALNGKPGVSDDTRAHILAVAREHNWEPDPFARSLQRGIREVVGLVLPATDRQIREESFHMLFIAGLESELRAHRHSLLLHVEDTLAGEIEIYRRWAGRGAVDCAILVDLRPDDPRLDLVRALELPAVLAGRPEHDDDWTYCYNSDADDTTRILEHLYRTGARRIAHLTGEDVFLIVGERARAGREFAASHPDLRVTHYGVGFSHAPAAVAECVTKVLAEHPMPDAFVCDSDLLAVRLLGELRQRGVRVPEQTQIVAFDDSIMCELAHPAITALDRRPGELGRQAARLAVDHERPRGAVRVRSGELRLRGTTR